MSTTDDPDPGDGGPAGTTLAVVDALVQRFGEGAQQVCAQQVAWPADNRLDRARFTRLKDAYVKARYSKHYRVSGEDLDWLQTRVEELGQAVHAVCGEHLDRLRASAAIDLAQHDMR